MPPQLLGTSRDPLKCQALRCADALQVALRSGMLSSEVAWRLTPAGGNDIGAPLLAEAAPEPKSARLGFVAGMIAEDKLHSFERLLFRATRGNMFLKSASVGTVVDPTTTEKVEKAVFVVFFAGERARSKILKVCLAVDAFHTSIGVLAILCGIQQVSP